MNAAPVCRRVLVAGGELARPFRISRPAISKHLRVLEEAGLVRRTRDGRINRCTLEPEPMRAAAEWVEQYRAFWEGQLDALSRFMEANNGEVVPPRRLAFTWDWEDPGSRVGDTLVAADIIDAGNGAADVVITHTRFADAERAANHERGWTQLLHLIERHVTEEGK